MDQHIEEMEGIKKAVIPIAGVGTRFLPLSLALSKEFFPLADKPIVQYLIEEIKNSGIKEIIFIINPKQKMILNYFNRISEMEKLLTQRKKEKQLKELKDFQKSIEGLKISFAIQKNPLGDGHAILQAGKLIGKKSFAVSFGDDVIDAQEPSLLQLINIFKTCRAPVIALKQLPREKVSDYGNVEVEKIANHLYKVKKIVEKPIPSQIVSNFVIVGKYILTSEILNYLKEIKPSEKGEIILGEVIGKMLQEGKVIYGYEVKGEWLECGDKTKWLKSFFYFTLKDERFGKDLKDYLKTLKN